MIYYSLKFYLTARQVRKLSVSFLAQFGARKINEKAGEKIHVESKFQKKAFFKSNYRLQHIVNRSNFSKPFQRITFLKQFIKFPTKKRKFPTKCMWLKYTCHILLRLTCSQQLFQNQGSTQSTTYIFSTNFPKVLRWLFFGTCLAGCFCITEEICLSSLALRLGDLNSVYAI